ncbi:carbonate dehydratase [Coraliomargarita sp. SDUM461004]|uniref:Carbonic anhydrase n=1 Tax=Thalassobacterium sedimentorum TaxID=3041258 RepID=A0ABU1AKJ1_9BACT|nr:carbonate dehydratase [Coraliomargarita sp. SDUM461004]MDQ8195332.1 carbonate dehydratase [Coraliomargarita sp. SDUM461004]
MPTLKQLIDNNRQWVQDTMKEDPTFFDKLSTQQNPDYLWIGCSDSRVPANQITGLMPGEVFVHRNIANVVVHTDLNLLSVLQYAVDVLQVEHIMVVGHYGCGGVKAASEKKPFGLIDNWLRHIQDVETLYTNELAPLQGEAYLDRLCELNVCAQAENVRRTSVVQDAWRRGQKIDIHAWIYSLKDGHLKPLQDAIQAPK